MTSFEGRRRPGDSRAGDPVDDAGPVGGGDEDAPDEALGRLGAGLEPIEPPAPLRAALLERIKSEPQTASPTEPETAGSRPESVVPDGSRGGAHSGRGAGSHGDEGLAEVVPLRRRWRAVGLRAAAAVLILGAGIGVGRWTAMGAMAPTEHYAHLNQAQDVQRVTDTMPDGHVATLTWSRDMSMTALSLPAEMMQDTGGVLRVWLRKGGVVTSLGSYDPAAGTGFTFLDLMPEAGEQVFITREADGGAGQPTGEALVTFDVRADGTATRRPAEPTTGSTSA